MPSTNGHGPKRAILYARVSTDEQARSGYSLSQQLEALREYASREGYDIAKEIEDRGHSGATLARPGLDRVRDLVAAGTASIVLAQDRDRFAREPAHCWILREELAKHGCKLHALNDRGDDSPEGMLTDGILDQLAKYERAKVAERTRRGLLQKAREGKVIKGPKANYGFTFNDTEDGLLVHQPEMRIVEKIFRMAASGMGPKAMQTRLYAHRQGDVAAPHPESSDGVERSVQATHLRRDRTPPVFGGGREARPQQALRDMVVQPQERIHELRVGNGRELW
jgi:DNA invertase Pin-like site-specific DNA recombinase